MDKTGTMDKQYGFPTRVKNFTMVQCGLSVLDLPPSTMNNESERGGLRPCFPVINIWHQEPSCMHCICSQHPHQMQF